MCFPRMTFVWMYPIIIIAAGHRSRLKSSWILVGATHNLWHHLGLCHSRYALEPPANSTQSLNSILSNQSHRSTYRSQIKLSKLNRISLTQKRINDSLKDVGDLICSSQFLWSPLLSATSEHLSMKMQIPTIHCVHLIYGSRRKCHAPTTTINYSLRLKRWTGGETTCEATI
jgi:hypothetical protein